MSCDGLWAWGGGSGRASQAGSWRRRRVLGCKVGYRDERRRESGSHSEAAGGAPKRRDWPRCSNTTEACLSRSWSQQANQNPPIPLSKAVFLVPLAIFPPCPSLSLSHCYMIRFVSPSPGAFRLLGYLPLPMLQRYLHFCWLWVLSVELNGCGSCAVPCSRAGSTRNPHLTSSPFLNRCRCIFYLSV
jgi:hypothetical protein